MTITTAVELDISQPRYVYTSDGSTGSYADVQNTTLLITSDYSLEAWMRPRGDWTDGTVRDIFNYYIDANNYLLLQTRPGQTVRLTHRRNAVEVNQLVTSDFPQDEWVHFAFTFNDTSNTQIIYINGSSTYTTTGIGQPMSTGALDIELGKNNPVDGSYSDMRLWDDVRTGTEISDNIHSTLAGTEAGLVGYWKMTEGTGTTLADSDSVNNNDLTITGTGHTWDHDNVPNFVDISTDVISNKTFNHGQGISGSRPKSLVASPGKFTFWLNNSAQNSAGLAGYYSPDHANIRTGFEIGAEARVKYTYDGTDYYKWRGKIYDIFPNADSLDPFTRVVAFDWMRIAQTQKFQNIMVAQNQRGDQALTTVVDTLPQAQQPNTRSFDTGKSTYPFVFDSERDEKSSQMSVMQKIAQSELARIYVNHQGGDGEQLVFENRHHAVSVTAVQYDFDDSISAIRTTYPYANIFTKLISRAFPREISTGDVVLAQLQKSFSIPPGETRTLKLEFRDPSSGDRISASSLTAQIASTDYLGNAQEDGGGADQTADLIVATSTTSGNSKAYDITNGGAGTVWITKFQQQGKSILLFDPVTYETESTPAVIADKGEHVLRFDLPYEDDYNVAVDFGDYLLGTWENSVVLVNGLTFYPERSTGLAQAFCDIDIGHRVTVNLPQVGIDQDYFVNKINSRWDRGLVKASYGLRPAESTVVMQLGSAIYGVLDAAECKLAF